jgi:hypothetical protein
MAEELIRSSTQQREIGQTISASASLITRGGGVVTVFRRWASLPSPIFGLSVVQTSYSRMWGPLPCWDKHGLCWLTRGSQSSTP